MIALLLTGIHFFSPSSSGMDLWDKKPTNLTTLERDIYGLVFTAAGPYARTQLLQVSKTLRQMVHALGIKDLYLAPNPIIATLSFGSTRVARLNETLYVLNNNKAQIEEINLIDDHRRIFDIKVPAGIYGFAELGGKLYIAHSWDSIYIFDPSAPNEIEHFNLTDNKKIIDLIAFNSLIYIAHYDGKIDILDPLNNHRIIDTINLGPGISCLAIFEGRLFAAHNDGVINFINNTKNHLQESRVLCSLNPNIRRIFGLGGMLYVANWNGKIDVIDPKNSNNIFHTYHLEPEIIDIIASEEKLYVAHWSGQIDLIDH